MYNKELILEKIYEKYSNVSLNDDFFNMKIGVKSRKEIVLKKLYNVAAILIIGTIIGSVGYAAYYAITRKPSNYSIFNKKISFNDKYDKYSNVIEKEVAKSENDSVLELVSTNYDGGYAVLEMKMTFSEADKEYFQLGQKMYSDEEIQERKEEETKYFRDRLDNYELYKQDVSMTKEEYEEKYKTAIQDIEESWENARNLEFGFDFNTNLGMLIVDGKTQNYTIDAFKEKVEKITDNEYRIYYYVFVPDEYKTNKNDFTLHFKDLQLVRSVDEDTIIYGKNTISGKDSFTDSVVIKLTGEFDCEFSDKNVDVKYLDNSKISENNLTYKILTQKMEYVKVTPMQTIVKIKSDYNGLTEETFAAQSDAGGYVGRLDFRVLNDNNEEVDGLIVVPNKTVTFKNSDVEIWQRYQTLPRMGNQDYVGAKMEEISYIIISNDDYDKKITVVPTRYIYQEDKMVDIGENYEIEIDK